MDASVARRSRWAIVLSGGSGQRMRPLISAWLGEDRPKQYCTFVGGRSMLQHTLDRAAKVVPPENILTVIGPGQRPFYDDAVRTSFAGEVIEQPMDRGTAGGLFLAAAHVYERDPEATLLILPSDHYVSPEGRFYRYLIHACHLAGLLDDQLVLLGAVPDRAETDYGWIDAARDRTSTDGECARAKSTVVKGFYEKPSKRSAETLLRRGCLWNTMAMAVRLRTLWALGSRYVPDTIGRLEILRQVRRRLGRSSVSGEQQTIALARAFQYMQWADFSRDVLQQADGWCRVLRMEDVEWSDWGRPERVESTLDRLCARPAFPRKSLRPSSPPQGGLAAQWSVQ